MHMADALLSPAVGATMWAVSAAAIAGCSRRLAREPDPRRAPLMGVLGAFLFAAQMINFSIPGTGSSGHLGGGLLLAILLGPHAAFIVVASVLVVQALFFADGGLLALGCNIFNLGFLPAFVGYSAYRWIAGAAPDGRRALVATMVAAVLSLQLGALGVVLETVASGVSALPVGSFALFMLPIHLAIGLVEGVVTASIVAFVRTARPEVLPHASTAGRPVTTAAATFLVLALALGGIGAWVASDDPDGLEWSIARIAGSSAYAAPGVAVHAALDRAQRRVALMPDYGFRRDEAAAAAASPARGASAAADRGRGDRLGTSVAGLLGSGVTLALALLFGFALRRAARRG